MITRPIRIGSTGRHAQKLDVTLFSRDYRNICPMCRIYFQNQCARLAPVDCYMKSREIRDDEMFSGPATFGVVAYDSRMGSKFRLATLCLPFGDHPQTQFIPCAQSLQMQSTRSSHSYATAISLCHSLSLPGLSSELHRAASTSHSC
jgi:hypothetical protein